MKQIGELNAAPDALDQAEREDEPYQLQVFDIGQYIEVLEEQVWKGKVGKPMQIDRDDSKAVRADSHTLGDTLSPCGQ